MSIGSEIPKKTWIRDVEPGNKTRQAARPGRYQSNPKYAFRIYIYLIFIYNMIIYYIIYIYILHYSYYIVYI